MPQGGPLSPLLSNIMLNELVKELTHRGHRFEKTCVSHISKVKYLGYSFYNYRGKCRFRVHPKSVTKMRNRIRELTNRSNGWGNECRALKLTQFIRGWVNYFGMADMKKLLKETDEWLRHKIRTIYWKQWKKVKTKFR